MRVAICISGQLREFDETFPSLRRFILERFQCDVFVSTWNDIGLAAVPTGDPQGILDRARELYKPVKMDVESWSTVRKGWGDLSFFEQRKRPDSNVEGVLAMWYKIARANQLKIEAERSGGFIYDVVIRSRSDVHYFESPEVDRTSRNYLHLGDHYGYGGLPDQFAFGRSSLMDLYADLFRHLAEYVKQGCPVHPETLLRWHMLQVMPQGYVFSQTPFRIHRSADYLPRVCTDKLEKR